jgi:heme-degrading monooxygenase HmoA
MAIGLLFDGVGVSQDQYEQVFNQVMPNGQRPPGLLTHHAGPTEDSFCVIETWESQETVQRFFEERLGAALAAAKIQVQPKLFEVVNAV